MRKSPELLDHATAAFLAFLCILLTTFLLRCGADLPTVPLPTPRPSATPTPTAFVPLSIVGSRFMQGPQPLDLRGIAWCCEGAEYNGWPTINAAALQETKRLGGNFAHIRLGPHSILDGANAARRRSYSVRATSDPTVTSAFLPVGGGKVDVDSYNPLFEAHVLSMIAMARDLGIYVEVDLLDGWALRTLHSAWSNGANVNGVDEDGCGVTRGGLSARQTAFVERWVTLTAPFDNVIYQISNEVFLCSPAERWEQGVADIVRRLAPGRFVGSNAAAPWSVSVGDYVTYHGDGPPPPQAVPAATNETEDSVTSAEAYCAAYAQAKASETYMWLWRGNRTAGELVAAAACWKEN